MIKPINDYFSHGEGKVEYMIKSIQYEHLDFAVLLMFGSQLFFYF